MNCLVVVAHPDDETIWMGGYILKHPEYNWHILSLCRSSDPDRAPKFKRVCKELNSTYAISDLEDENLPPIETKEIIKIIEENIPSKKFDIVFTHGTNGEYGHIRHIETNTAVKEMIQQKKLFCNELFFFSYERKGEFCNVKDSSAKFIKLDEEIFMKKKRLIRDVYGFSEGGFEVESARDTEAFDKE